MGLMIDFTKHFHPDYMCKVKKCSNHIYNDIDRVQHQGYCRGCHHKEWLKQEEAKWDDWYGVRRDKENIYRWRCGMVYHTNSMVHVYNANERKGGWECLT